MGHKMKPVNFNDDGSVDYECDSCPRKFTQRQFVSPRRVYQNKGDETVEHNSGFGSGIQGTNLEMNAHQPQSTEQTEDNSTVEKDERLSVWEKYLKEKK